MRGCTKADALLFLEGNGYGYEEGPATRGAFAMLTWTQTANQTCATGPDGFAVPHLGSSALGTLIWA